MPKTHKLLIFADAHSDTGAWGGRSIFGDSKFGIRQIFEEAARGEYEAVIGLGDLIDVSQPRPDAVAIWATYLSTLPEDVQFHYIMGQHEYSDPPWLSVLPDTVHLHGVSKRWGGLWFTGLDYQPSGILREKLDALPGDTDVLLCHQAWKDLLGIGDVQGELRDVPHRVQAVFTGDYHVYEELTVERDDGSELRVWSPGATHMREINAPTEHFILSVQIRNGDLKIKKIPLKSRTRFGKYLITNGTELDETIEQLQAALEGYKPDPDIPPSLHKPLIWVECSPDVVGAYARVTRLVKDAGHLFWKPAPVAATPAKTAAREARKKMVAGGLIGCLPVIVPDRDSELFKDTARLLSAGDIDVELSAICQEHLQDGPER